MRVALYIRVSSEEQARHGLSLQEQRDALTRYAQEHKLTVVGIYEDAGISARKPYKKRPALLRLLDDCKAGKVDTILFAVDLRSLGGNRGSAHCCPGFVQIFKTVTVTLSSHHLEPSRMNPSNPASFKRFSIFSAFSRTAKAPTWTRYSLSPVGWAGLGDSCLVGT